MTAFPPIPAQLKLTNTVQFARTLYDLPESKLYMPDFGSVTWIEPFAMLILAKAFRDLKARYPETAIIPRTPNSDPVNYARWMGFFKAAGLSQDTLNAPGSETYLPLTFVPVSELSGGAAHASEGASKTAERLAKQLLLQESGALVDAVTYAFQEVLRNVVEHSGASEVGYAAQYWGRGPNKETVEIALMDAGIGLQAGLTNNPHLDITSDRDAIMLALTPGVSGKFYKGVREDPNNPYQNSGFGLYMLYRLCNEGGKFFIGSSQAGLSRKKGTDNVDHAMNFQGTILRLRLNAPKLTNIRELLDQFRKEGEQIASRYGQGVVLTAATMSKMLREDFTALNKPLEVDDRVHHRQYKAGTVIELITLSTKEPGAVVKFDSGLRKKVALTTLSPLFDL